MNSILGSVGSTQVGSDRVPNAISVTNNRIRETLLQIENAASQVRILADEAMGAVAEAVNKEPASSRSSTEGLLSALEQAVVRLKEQLGRFMSV